MSLRCITMLWTVLLSAALPAQPLLRFLLCMIGGYGPARHIRHRQGFGARYGQGAEDVHWHEGWNGGPASPLRHGR